jgi:hypothetical protein
LKNMIAQGLVKMKKVIKDGGIQPDWGQRVLPLSSLITIR